MPKPVTVGELIKVLKKFPKNLEIRVKSNGSYIEGADLVVINETKVTDEEGLGCLFG